jgi:uncharacterized RDD family membrane protein YckC
LQRRAARRMLTSMSTDLGSSETPEAEIALPPAPHAPRLLAWLADFGLVMLVAAQVSRPFPLAIPFGMLVAYHTLTVWLTGQTVGKALFGLQLVRGDANPSLPWSLGRASVGYFGCTLFGLGLLPAFRDGRHRHLADRVFSSEVVVVDGGRLDVRRALRRLKDFCLMRHQEAENRAEAAGTAALALLWGWLGSVATSVSGLIDAIFRAFGGSGSGGGASLVGELTTRAKVLVSAAAMGVSAAVVSFVPPAADAQRWLLQPRYYFGGPEDEERFAGTWLIGPFTETGNRYYDPVGNEKWTVWLARECASRCTYDVARVHPNPDIEGLFFSLEPLGTREWEGSRERVVDCVDLNSGALLENDGYEVKERVVVTRGRDRRVTVGLEQKLAPTSDAEADCRPFETEFTAPAARAR